MSSPPGRAKGIAGGATALPPPSGIAGLFAWWRRQIGSLLPGGAFFSPVAQDAIIIDIRSLSPDPNVAFPATGQILRRRSGQEQIVVQLDFSQPNLVERAVSDAIILRLPPQMVLKRQMTLPVAAERDLPTLIHFQMPRLTPFNASEVFWGISEPVRDQASLKLTLHVVQRNLVERLLGPLARISLEPSVLEDGDTGIILGRLGRRNGSPRSGRLGIGFAVAAGCLLIPLVSQQVRLDTAGHRLRVLAPVQRQIALLHGQIANLTRVQRLIGHADQGLDVFHMLARLTNALPDGTWLNDLTVNGNVVTFDGQSSDAAQLIPILTATPGLMDVSFNAPVTRTTDGATDMFSIQLTVGR